MACLAHAANKSTATIPVMSRTMTGPTGSKRLTGPTRSKRLRNYWSNRKQATQKLLAQLHGERLTGPTGSKRLRNYLAQLHGDRLTGLTGSDTETTGPTTRRATVQMADQFSHLTTKYHRPRYLSPVTMYLLRKISVEAIRNVI
jgi:hypothetical protein